MQLTAFANNIVERALNKAMLNRRNALFCKTLNGAPELAICSMSLIHTCELNVANPFDYLTGLAETRRGVEAKTIGVDAVELSRAQLGQPAAA